MRHKGGRNPTRAAAEMRYATGEQEFGLCAKQVKGVGTLIALTYVLTVEEPRGFRRSRDLGCYLGLRPGRRNSGSSQPQLHIGKEGGRYLRILTGARRTLHSGTVWTALCGDGD
jgi:transposase